MKFEIRKITGTRYAAVFFLLLLVSNAFFFFQHLRQTKEGGYTFSEMKRLYESPDSLAEIEKELVAETISDPSNPTAVMFGNNFEIKPDLREATAERIQTVKNYPQLLASMIADSSVQVSTGLFRNDPFSTATLKKTLSAYEKLQGWVKPEVGFFGGVELLTSFPLTDMLILLLGGYVSLCLISTERTFGLLAISHSTKNGRCYLYRTKFLTMLFLVFSAMLILYGTNVLMTVRMMGLGNLLAPVQSVYTMERTPYAWTVLGYVFFFFLQKMLWSISICSLFFCICCGTRGVLSALSTGILVLSTTFILNSSTNPWAAFLNFAYLNNTADLFGRCYFLNLFNIPVSLQAVSVGILLMILLLSVSLGGYLYCHRSAVTSSRRIAFPTFSVGCHTSLFGHEWHKLFITNSGLVILAGFLLFQLCSYRDFQINMSSWEHYYRHYSTVLSGTPNEEKERYLAEEQLRYNRMNEQLMQYAQICGNDWQSYELLTHDIQMQMVGQEPFNAAKRQYEQLSSGQMYIYKSGYDRLFGTMGLADEKANTIKMILVCILGLAGVYSVEKETAMDQFYSAYAAECRINKKKRQVVLLFLFLALVIAYLPQYIYISHNYGLPLVRASASSLQLFNGMPQWCTIWMLFVFSGALHLVVGALSCSMILYFSKKIRNTVLTILLCLTLTTLLSCILLVG